MAPITRNLIIINVLCFIGQILLEGAFGGDVASFYGGLWYIGTPYFHFWQPVSYMFLHGGLTHLFFNMFSLWMFGGVVERAMGAKRFLLFYFVCGIGAAICQEFWQFGETVMNTFRAVPTVGASGACYGILLAFGMSYPNQRIMLLFPPIPMKAKYFVIAYAVIELFSAFSSNGNVAHFAHLGGMLFGLLLILYWRWEAKRPQRPKTTVKWATDSTADWNYNREKQERERRVDALLDKVRRSGYESLTEEEKRDLFRFSR